MSTLTFITCGSVDDGKSTLIGRLLLDSQAVLRDQLEAVSRTGAADLALLTDGLSAEREQGITIDVAWRYFATPRRKFIIGDSPGHEQYTRNMVTAASNADAAVVLVDVTKLAWQAPPVQLLPQTRRHALLCQLLRVPHIVFAINKLDAVDEAAPAFANVSAALNALATEAGIAPAGIVPVSGLEGHNVIAPHADWGWYPGPALLPLLEKLPDSHARDASFTQGTATAVPVQYVEKTASASSTTVHGRRIAWGHVAQGAVQVGDELVVSQASGSQRAVKVAKLLNTVREPVLRVTEGHGAGVVFDSEIDVSRGDWLLAAAPALQGVDHAADDDFDTPAQQASISGRKSLQATVSWLDDEPLVPGRVYWALHGHRWVKAKVTRIHQRLNIHSFAHEPATRLEGNDIADVELALSAEVPALPHVANGRLGSLILVDAASHKTAAAVLVR